MTDALTIENNRAAVRRFYDDVWNRRNLAAAEGLLAEDLAFRGSLGAEHHSRDGFLGYVAEVTGALEHFRCDIDMPVAGKDGDGDGAAARMRFSGRHTGVFMGVAPTGRVVGWSGAAFFRFRGGLIAEVWVLGDLAALSAQLGGSGGDG